MACITPGRLAFIAALLTYLLLQYALVCKAQDEWLLRPGTVHICEGDTARLIWDYNHSMGKFASVYFHKIKPDWMFLIGLHQKETPFKETDEVHLIENSTYGITIDRVTLSHSGSYEIEVYFEDIDEIIYDTAELLVLSSSVCPDRHKYLRPVISYQLMSDESSNVIVINDNVLELHKPGMLRLIVAIPAADPPVSCTLSKGQKQQYCTGKSEEYECEKQFHFGDVLPQEITVTLNFIALETRSIQIYVYNKGDHPPNEISTTIQQFKTTKYPTTLITSTTIPGREVVSTASPEIAIKKPIPGETTQAPYVGEQVQRISTADIAGIIAAIFLAGVFAAVLIAIYKNRNKFKIKHPQGEGDILPSLPIDSPEENSSASRPLLRANNDDQKRLELPVQPESNRMNEDGVALIIDEVAEGSGANCKQEFIAKANPSSDEDQAPIDCISHSQNPQSFELSWEDKTQSPETLPGSGSENDLSDATPEFTEKLGNKEPLQHTISHKNEEEKPNTTSAQEDGGPPGNSGRDEDSVDKQNIELAKDNPGVRELAVRPVKEYFGLAELSSLPINLGDGDGPLKALINSCPDNRTDKRNNTDRKNDECFIALKAAQKATHIKSCGLDGKDTNCYNNDIHRIHKHIEKLLHGFFPNFSPDTVTDCALHDTPSGQSPTDLFDFSKSLEETGSFYMNNKVGIFDELKYIAKWESSEIVISIVDGQKFPETLRVSIPRQYLEGLDVSSYEYLELSLEALLRNQLEIENLSTPPQVRCKYIPQSAGVCVQLTWSCPAKHTHNLRLVITPAIVWEGKCLKDVCQSPINMNRPPFDKIKEEFLKQRVLLVPDPNCDITVDKERITSIWRVSFDDTEKLHFRCLDEFSPNTRQCFHLLKFLNKFLPMRMVRIEDDGVWSCRSVISSYVLYNSLLSEVLKYPSKEDWDDNLLPERLASILKVLSSFTYQDFCEDITEPIAQLSHLNSKQQESLQFVMRDDLKEIRETLFLKDQRTTGKTKVRFVEDKSKQPGTLARAVNYTKYDTVCVLGLSLSGEVHYTVLASWSEIYGFGASEKRTNAAVHDYYCYRIPPVKFACERFSFYKSLYDLILKKIETRCSTTAPTAHS